MGSITSPVRTAKLALDALYAPALGPDRDSWLFLIKRISLLLLSSISKHPWCVIDVISTLLERLQVLYSSTATEAHLRILQSFVTPSSSAPTVGDSSSQLALAMMNHLLSQQLYTKLGHAITQIVRHRVDLSADVHNPYVFYIPARREERSSTKPTSRYFSDNIHVILLERPDDRAIIHSHSYNPLTAIPPTA